MTMMKVLVTSGGTLIPIDDVRRITNMSSGKFGSKIVESILASKTTAIHLHSQDGVTPFDIKLNARICYSNDAITDFFRFYDDYRHYYIEHTFKTFEQYQITLKSMLLKYEPDVTILSAAVSDYGMDHTPGKISSNLNEINIKLVKLPKVISQVKEWYPDTFLVGFKLLSGATVAQLVEAATKLENSAKTDLVVANDLSDLRTGKHRLYIVKNGEIIETLDRTESLASDLWNFIRMLKD